MRNNSFKNDTGTKVSARSERKWVMRYAKISVGKNLTTLLVKRSVECYCALIDTGKFDLKINYKKNEKDNVVWQFLTLSNEIEIVHRWRNYNVYIGCEYNM